MRQIESVSIWKDGKIYEAVIFNVFASNVILNQNANFTYELYSLSESKELNILTSGYLTMNPDEYSKWEKDEFAWEFVANSIGVKIIGDYFQEVKENEISLEK